VTADLLQVRTPSTQGSLPASGPECVAFGANTTCIEVRCGARVPLLDAGPDCSLRDARQGERATRAHLSFTHCHYDYIMGLCFFDCSSQAFWIRACSLMKG